MADPITEAGAPPSVSRGSYFHGAGVYLDLLRKWVGGNTGVSLPLGSAIRALGDNDGQQWDWQQESQRAEVSNLSPSREGGTASKMNKNPPIHARPCPRPSTHAI